MEPIDAAGIQAQPYLGWVDLCVCVCMCVCVGGGGGGQFRLTDTRTLHRQVDE